MKRLSWRACVLFALYLMSLMETHTMAFCSSFGMRRRAIATTFELYNHQARQTKTAANSIPPSIREQIQKAVELSKPNTSRTTKTATNPLRQAAEACALWQELFSPDQASTSTLSTLPKSILGMCHALHASTLVTLGRDSEAIALYQKALACLLSSAKDGDASVSLDTLRSQWDTEIALAQALQRRMLYKQAQEAFSHCFDSMQNYGLPLVLKMDKIVTNSRNLNTPNLKKEFLEKTEDAALGAATCALRQQQIGTESAFQAAIVILESFQRLASSVEKDPEQEEKDFAAYGRGEAAGLLGALYHVQSCHDSFNNKLPHVVVFGSKQKRTNKSRRENIGVLLRYAVEKTQSPFYRWILYLRDGANANRGEIYTPLPPSMTTHTNVMDQHQKDNFSMWAGINNSPLDDPHLRILDDKIHLHELLSSQGRIDSNDDNNNDNFCELFWPRGFILPTEYHKLIQYEKNKDKKKSGELGKTNSSMWIVKDRAGYGSHGNQVIVGLSSLPHELQGQPSSMTTGQTKAELGDDNKKDHDDNVLCQKVIHPPLLLHERKFSLRIYVLLLPTTADSGNDGSGASLGDKQVYLSHGGLVKLARSPYRVSTNRETQMTNSALASMVDDGQGYEGGGGKEFNEQQQRKGDSLKQQYDLLYLKTQLEQDGYDYDTLWEGIQRVVQTVMSRYYKKEKSQRFEEEKEETRPHQRRFACLGLPKILGFDFLVGQDHGKHVEVSQNDIEGVAGNNCPRLCPWLLEVNRFPGLTPRGDEDRFVKCAVVRDAWVMASVCHERTRGFDGRSNCHEEPSLMLKWDRII